MARNIVLCCDGTSNQFAQDRTSVLKLFQALEKDPAKQRTFYHPGIGTRAPTGTGTKVGSWFARTAGLAWGYGLQDDIADAYTFLMNTHQEGDHVYIFGFSRGAYTARVIAAMLHLYGLIPAGNDAMVPYAVKMLWAISKARGQKQKNAYFDLARDFRRAMGPRKCPVRFLGVWDTVNSVGLVSSPLTLPYTRANPSVAIVRHAKAIDELRGFFRVNWFQADPKRDIVEVWFPGSHCDVGGGYPEGQGGMSKYALEWIARSAQKAGLLLDEERLDEVLGLSRKGYAPASPAAERHNSMTGLWKLLEFVPRKHWDFDEHRWRWRMNLFRRRNMLIRPKGQEVIAPIVHPVAWEIPGYAARLPPEAIPLDPDATPQSPPE